jgi:hypothetical protein
LAAADRTDSPAANAQKYTTVQVRRSSAEKRIGRVSTDGPEGHHQGRAD